MSARRAPTAVARLPQGARAIDTTDLRCAGFSRDMAEREVRAGRWQRGARGVYLPHSAPPVEADLVAVARTYLSGPFVVTGPLVLHALGLRWVPHAGTLHVLVQPDDERPSSGLVRVTRTTCFDSLDTWVRYGTRYAAPSRAIVDTTRSLRSLRDVRAVILGGVADGWAAPDELRALLDGGQRNGSALTRRAVLDAERGCASPPEAELVDSLIGCRIPFYVNPQLWLDGVLLGSPDVWLVGLGIGGEVESKERHESETQIESTYDRHERINARGLELVHLSVRRIRADPDEAAAHLLRRARSRLLLPPDAREPAGLVVVPRGPLLR